MKVPVTTHSRVQTVKSLTRVLWDDRHQARWLVQRQASAAYLGWHGRGNLGDEAMYAAARHHAVGPLPPAPLHRASRAVASGVRIRTLVLGGGTLIGRDEWASRLDAILTRSRIDRLVVMGTGCEDLDRALELGIASDAGLKRWAALLQNADLIGVRGPDSQASLEALGVGSQVVGDLGLLADELPYNVETLAVGVKTSRRIGVNVAGVDDALGSDRNAQLSTLVNTVSLLKQQGHTPVFFSMEVEDDKLARRLAEAAGVDMRPFRNDLGDLLGFLRGCSAVLSERLHGGILATALDTPNLLVGYKPKCLDFSKSVGATKNMVSLEDERPHRLAERVVRVVTSETPDAMRSELAGRRATLLDMIRGIGN